VGEGWEEGVSEKREKKVAEEWDGLELRICINLNGIKIRNPVVKWRGFKRKKIPRGKNKTKSSKYIK